MSEIRVHVLHTGEVCVAPDLPFGGASATPISASGVFRSKKGRIWLPVSVYYVESPYGKVLLDTGWHRDMSPEGVFDKNAQIKSLGNLPLYEVNQGVVPIGQTVSEKLQEMGVQPSDIDLVLLSHLDCDHANGLREVAEAKCILVSPEELKEAERKVPMDKIRYNPEWWRDTKIEAFEWNGTEGPFGRSFDVFGDGTFVMIWIPGHSAGLCALRITGSDGRFVLLFADGGYAKLSWEAQLPSGIATNREQQKRSLEWIRDVSLSPECITSLATHDPGVQLQVITLPL